MLPVAVRIFHAEPAAKAGPLVHWLARARRDLADRHAESFRRLGLTDVTIVSDPPDDTPFGTRLRRVVPGAGGLVLMGSGAIPLARPTDYRSFVAVAAADERAALANNRYSADVVAVADGPSLREVPELPGDNALPRWLEEVAGIGVRDLAQRWRLQIDYDSPLDLLLTGGGGIETSDVAGADLSAVRTRLREVARVAGDRRAEILIAGRTSTSALRWVERRLAARTRAIVEERGLRASTELAQSGSASATNSQRPPRSLLGHLLDADGPATLGALVADLAEAALIDTRVLLAHRLGPDERTWPSAEDRFASDLLLPDRIGDRWLRTLTDAALDAPVPILLGGHTLVGPGLRLVFRQRRTT